MKYHSAKSPQWANPEHTAITLEVDFVDLSEEFVPFNASPADIEAHGKELYVRAFNGEFGTIAEYVAPPVAVPKKVSMRQARLALHANGHLGVINGAISQVSPEAQIEWEYATEVVRTSPLTQGMISILSLTEEQADQLFLEAAAL